MADIATLSFAIDSKPLVDANRELAKLPAAAGGAEKAVDNLNKSTKELEQTTVAATKATRNLGQYARPASTGWGAAAAAATSAANANRQMAGATAAAATAAATAERVISSATIATAGAAAAARMAVNDNQKLALSATAVSVAYRLAAAVLTGIFAGAVNSTMRAFVKETDSISGAFKTLGETWSATFDVGYQASTPLRHAIEDLTIAIESPAFTGFVQLIGRILFAALTLAVKGVTALVEGFSWLIDNIVAVSKAILPVLAALELLDRAFEEVFGTGLFEIVKKSVNWMIGAFVAAFGDIKFVWENFPDIVGAAFVGAVNAAIRAINVMVSKATEGINTLIGLANKIPGVNIDPIKTGGPLSEMGNPAATRLGGAAANRGAQQQAELTRDYLGEAGNYLTNGLGRRRITDTLPEKGGAAGAADPYAKTIEGAKEYILTKKAEAEAVGQTVLAASRLKHEQELLNKAQNDGKLLSDAQKAALKDLAGQMAEADNALAKAKFIDDYKTKSEEFLAQQQVERDALFLSAQAADALRMSTEMLNAAKRQGIELSPAEVEAITATADAMAASKAKTDELKEIVGLGREVFKGFFSDMREGLMNGKSVWDSFANAAVNALNRIAEKLIEMAVNKLFESAFPSTGGGGGGGGILNLLGGGSGGTSSGLLDGIMSLFNFFPTFANGAAFRAGNVIPFARGDVFNSPTFFPMSGGRSGVMGEAGPEAIMPLKRGPGGRLGVEAANSNRQQPVIVHVYANEGFVTAKAEGAAVRVVNAATPGIVKESVKKAGEQTPAVMARHEAQRGGEWR